jgi:hypothetical protein
MLDLQSGYTVFLAVTPKCMRSAGFSRPIKPTCQSSSPICSFIDDIVDYLVTAVVACYAPIKMLWAILAHRVSSNAPYGFLMRQWRKGACQSDPWVVARVTIL